MEITILKKKFTFTFLHNLNISLILLTMIAFVSLYLSLPIFAEDQKQVIPTEVTGTWTGGTYRIKGLPQQTTLILKKNGNGKMFTDKYEQNFTIDKLIKTANGSYVVYSNNFRDSQNNQYLLYVNGDQLLIYDRELQNNSSLDEHQASTLSRNDFDFTTRYLRDMDPTKLKPKASTKPVWNEVKANELKSFMEEYAKNGLEPYIGDFAKNNNSYSHTEINPEQLSKGSELKRNRVLVGKVKNKDDEMTDSYRVNIATSKDGTGTAQYNVVAIHEVILSGTSFYTFYFTIHEGKPEVLISNKSQGGGLEVDYMYPSYDPKLQEAFAAIVNE